MKYYLNGFHENKIEGAIEITDEKWIELLNKQSQGGVIQVIEGQIYCLLHTEQIKNGQLTDISETQAYKDKIIQEKETLFFKNFIEISIGCLRKVPKGYSSIVEAMNSAFNIVSIGGGLPAGILTIYTKPNFATVEKAEEWLEQNSFKNEAMTIQQFGALYVEFQTAWNNQEHI